jgi:hypothetical protein
MATNTLKRFRVFQVRKQFADKGENHADLILEEPRPACILIGFTCQNCFDRRMIRPP